MTSHLNADLIREADSFAAAVKDFTGDPSQRVLLGRKAEKLRLLLETPIDMMVNQLERAYVIGALHLLVEVGAFEKVPSEDSITAKDLAARVGIDESAIGSPQCGIEDVPFQN